MNVIFQEQSEGSECSESDNDDDIFQNTNRYLLLFFLSITIIV